MGERVFSDRCSDEEQFGHERPCHFVAGFTLGEITCPLWDRVSTLCQTDSERRFLRTYLNLVKDRHFPMLLPQARLGIAERRRPDFIAFVPIQKWLFRPFAIELDNAHGPELAARDDSRDLELTEMGFEVVRVKPPDGKTINDLKAIVEKFDKLMMRADSDPWAVAIDLEVWKTERELPDGDIPF